MKFTIYEKGVGYSMWARRFNMEQLLKTVSFMSDNKLKTYADVKAMYENLNPRYSAISEKIKSIDEQMENVSKLQKIIIDYSKTNGTYAKYKASGYSKKFKKENLGEITIYQNAKAEYKKIDRSTKLGKSGKLPSMQELKQEYAKLKSAKQNAYHNQFVYFHCMRFAFQILVCVFLFEFLHCWELFALT